MSIEAELEREASYQFGRLVDADIKVDNIHINMHRDVFDNGAITVEFNLGDYGDTDKVKGRNLHDVITEYMRRKGWTEANKPMKLIGSAVVAE